MAFENTETVDCDILIIGGGMSGCGAAFEARFWAGPDKRVVLAEKAAIERSGATGEGLSAINCYMGQRYGWNTPEDFVNYVVNDMMGLAREDLVYDVGRHVDNSVHLLEEWGLPIWKQENGQYERIGRWQIPIHGESIKPIAAEPARTALGEENIYERVAITHLLTDDDDPGKIAGACGFSVRDDKFYVFRSPVVIITTGGASNVFRPRSVSEGLGRTWYSVFATGSAYGLMIPAGVEMTQMEHRFVPTRFKDGYGPVGMWFQYFHAKVLNAQGDDYTVTRADELNKYEPYGSAIPTPTPLRNHQMFLDIRDGLGPMYMRTDLAMQALSEGDPAKMEQVRNEAWEDFLDMTISQALTWAAQNIAPEETPSEIVLAEPYIMGSHSGEAGCLGQRPRGHRLQRLLLGLQPHDHRPRPLRRRRRRWRRSPQVLLRLLHRGTHRRQGRGQLRQRQSRPAGRLRRPGTGDAADHPRPSRHLRPAQGRHHGRRDQSQLPDTQAGPGAAPEDHGRVRRRRLGMVHDQPPHSRTRHSP